MWTHLFAAHLSTAVNGHTTNAIDIILHALCNWQCLMVCPVIRLKLVILDTVPEQSRPFPIVAGHSVVQLLVCHVLWLNGKWNVRKTRRAAAFGCVEVHEKGGNPWPTRHCFLARFRQRTKTKIQERERGNKTQRDDAGHRPSSRDSPCAACRTGQEHT